LNPHAPPPLLVLVGPSAVGKPAYSYEIARRFRVEIISGDSVQVYRGMDIGSAKAPPPERERFPHHLIDILDPDEPYTAADFQKAAAELIRAIAARGRLPAIVGGTALYIESVVYDYRFPGAGADPQIRARWEAAADELGLAALHRMLAERDPAAAARIHPNDRKRIVRALEICEATGGTTADFRQKREKKSPYRLCMIGLTMDRRKLYERIDRRVDEMIGQGLVEEVRALLAKGYDRGLPAMQAIGYKEIAAYLCGETTLERAVELLKRNTRRFAKRQLSWFRTMPQIQWVDVTDESKFSTHCERINDIIATAFPSPDFPFHTPIS